MGCYLCAYKLTDSPRHLSALPADSAATLDLPLGTCRLCGVHACSQHAGRLTEFECAICVPGAAAQAALTQPPAGQTAADTSAEAAVAEALAPELPGVAEVDEPTLLLAMARLLNEYRVLATARARPGAPLPRNGDTLVGGIDVWLNARYRRDAVESTDWQAPLVAEPRPVTADAGVPAGQRDAPPAVVRADEAQAAW